MADLQESPAADGPQVLYMNGAVSADMPLNKDTISTQKASYSAFEIRIDKHNPNRAEMVPVPGFDEKLIPNYSAVLNPVFNAPVPKAGDKYIHVQQPAQLERVGDTWRVTDRGSLSYGPTPQVQQSPQVQQAPQQPLAPTPAPVQEPASQSAPSLKFTQYAPSTETGLVENRKAVGQALPQLNLAMTDQGQFGLNPQVNQERLIGDGLSKLEKYFDFALPPQHKIARVNVDQPGQMEQTPEGWKVVNKGTLAVTDTEGNVFRPVKKATPEQTIAAQPAQQAKPTPEANRFQLSWRQINDEAAPLEEITRYLSKHDIKLAEPISIKRDGEGKMTSLLNFSYDPAQVPATTAEGIIAGLNQAGQGNGLRVVEDSAQNKARLSKITESADNVATTIIRNEIIREIQPGREWKQDSKHLEIFLQQAGQQATQTVAATPQAAPVETPAATPPKTAASLGMDANPAPAAPTQATVPAAEQPKPGVGEFQITWRQKGDEVAPLAEMRAYLAELKDAGVAVGAMKFGPGTDGKLTGSFGVSYDPNAPDLTKLEGTIQGLKKVGGGLDVVEAPEQAVARRRGLGHEGQDKALDLAFPVKEAFGVRQWDSLSAQFSSAPKQALTAPEQAQQAAGIDRVKQIAKQQGKTSEEIIQDGKNLLEIDTSGNPVSAFLKNFYEHLNGAPKTRQNLEVDYEKTRQELQARLTAKAGNALPDGGPAEAVTKESPVVAAADKLAGATVAAVTAPAVQAGSSQAQATPTPAPAKPEPLFKEGELPKDKLGLFGLSIATLRESGQLEKLLNGEKTDLLAMQGGAQRDKPLIPFEGKLLLHREANGSVTLNVELPRQRLVIPNEIGGQPFTPEQRHNLETTGSAGLIRGLRDAAGNPYNGYVGVDPKMNTIVILPENKVAIKDEIAGVKLSPEQSHDLREGHLVHLPNMRRADGGKPFDGTVQIHAAKAGVEIRPEPYERQQRQQPELTQAHPVAEKQGQKQSTETAQVQRQEITPPTIRQEEPVQQRRSGPRR